MIGRTVEIRWHNPVRRRLAQRDRLFFVDPTTERRQLQKYRIHRRGFVTRYLQPGRGELIIVAADLEIEHLKPTAVGDDRIKHLAHKTRVDQMPLGEDCFLESRHTEIIGLSGELIKVALA